MEGRKRGKGKDEAVLTVGVPKGNVSSLCYVEGVRHSHNRPDALLRGPAASRWAFGRGRGGPNSSTQWAFSPTRDISDRAVPLIPPRARPRLPL
jgi:hypothetical protein